MSKQVLFIGGPFDGQTREWQGDCLQALVPYPRGVSCYVTDSESLPAGTTVYTLETFTHTGKEFNVAVDRDCNLFALLLENYRPTTQLSGKDRARILESARRDYHEAGDTFQDVINHVIDDARNAR